MKEYTSTNFWEKEWQKQRLRSPIEQTINRQILKIIKPVLRRGAKVLEIGCVPARRLWFLQNHFEVETFGLDYALQGLIYSVKEKNNLVCSDISFVPFADESFDLVFSLGVIEHFENPRDAIIKHISLAKKGGLVLITVPNFYNYSILSFVYKMSNKYKEIEKTHNIEIMQITNFQKLFEDLNIEPIINTYYGPFVIYSPPNYFLRRISTKVNDIIDRLAVISKIFSPDLVFIGIKR